MHEKEELGLISLDSFCSIAEDEADANRGAKESLIGRNFLFLCGPLLLGRAPVPSGAVGEWVADGGAVMLGVYAGEKQSQDGELHVSSSKSEKGELH